MSNYNQGRQLENHHAYVRAEMFEKKQNRGSNEEPTSRKIEGCVTKEGTKKMKKGDKNNMI